MNATREQIMTLAIAAGFKVFGTKIIAADNGSSGDADECAIRLVHLAQRFERDRLRGNGFEYRDAPFDMTKLYRIEEEA